MGQHVLTLCNLSKAPTAFVSLDSHHGLTSGCIVMSGPVACLNSEIAGARGVTLVVARIGNQWFLVKSAGHGRFSTVRLF